MTTLGSRIKALRENRNYTQSELGKKVGVGKTTVSNYETDYSSPDLETIEAIADVLEVTVDYLLGRTDHPKEIINNVAPVKYPRNTVKIPIYGRIAAGEPIEAIEDIIDYEYIPEEWLRGGKEYFCLVVKGDSMYPKYIEGDIVIIERTTECHSGDDCACYVNGYDATLKTVKRNEKSITLIPVNTSYSPKTYALGEVQIAGVVRELRRKF